MTRTGSSHSDTRRSKLRHGYATTNRMASKISSSSLYPSLAHHAFFCCASNVRFFCSSGSTVADAARIRNSIRPTIWVPTKHGKTINTKSDKFQRRNRYAFVIDRKASPFDTFSLVSFAKIRSQVGGVASRTLRENRQSERHKAILTG
jgi:hypothetical protein